jgi:hypothetical protein
MIYTCCDNRRRSILENQTVFNAIDFLEVVDNPSDPEDVRQRTLLVHFLHPLKPGQLTAANISIQGGERITNIVIADVQEEVSASPPGDPKILIVHVKEPGDFAPYTLSLVDPHNQGRPPQNFDPILSSIEFSFKVACESDFDCRQTIACAPPAKTQLDISYLAKDYASFRQLMLDRMAKVIPQWQETSPADLGIVLIELLAYLGDYLSYQQDAVATEAYLGTARRRTSVRRHVRLLDYPMHDGRNARTWVHFEVAGGVPSVTLQPGAGTQFFTRVNQSSPLIAIGSLAYNQALSQQPQVFELAEKITIYPQHNRMSFYTWGDLDCCLPRGATTAYLRDNFPNLKPGDVLIFQEVRGPKTGVPGDADPAHRQAVRLTQVTSDSDPVGGQFDQPPTNKKVDVTKITWEDGDALAFPLCISSNNGTEFFDNVSIAWGNIALADHGRTVNEDLPVVPAPNPALAVAVAPSGDPCPAVDNPCESTAPQATASRYRPALKQSPLTFTEPFQSTGPAADIINKRNLKQLLPAIYLALPSDPNHWLPQRDLLKSNSESQQFVVETEDDGSSFLRFGDDVLGSRPTPGSEFTAIYRVGDGISGNIGAESLAHIASDDPLVITDLSHPVILSVTNPLPASGGLDPEPLEVVRQSAPFAFRIQKRAVTQQDYGDMAKRCDSTLQRATATFRWTGSWLTAFLAADRQNNLPVNDKFKTDLRNCMEQFRMAGQDVDVETPAFVSLEIAMNVCVKPDYFTSDVETALLKALSNCTLPDGTKGVFNPDNFTFGQPVFLSPIYVLVQQTDGVESVNITKFQRQGVDSNVALNSGRLEVERLEIARLDNDPNFPEHGTLTLNMFGGR